jgi:hypothetical protein
VQRQCKGLWVTNQQVGRLLRHAHLQRPENQMKNIVVGIEAHKACARNMCVRV